MLQYSSLYEVGERARGVWEWGLLYKEVREMMEAGAEEQV